MVGVQTGGDPAGLKFRVVRDDGAVLNRSDFHIEVEVEVKEEKSVSCGTLAEDLQKCRDFRADRTKEQRGDL